ncbi:type II toxin-antitoxin system RelE/ParE family toxin [Cellulomonas sp.]|uniref:type II toxin-antitoxin system RelE family toxin n=1 Tax=Cellulomonas sp. TaxID=40001 RepID=UPI002D2DC9E1|nr:type II toxin-antitoxin system RelE/ParE family toxin [Cellulomonas sp.]HYQ74655.1 type II toxin-antitoxin system RelE/ParE family toxin [Cellulomonas sp.]
MSWEIGWVPTSRRALDRLPEHAATAAIEFVYGPLRENPYRVGKRLRAPLDDTHSARRGAYRVLYVVDEQAGTVVITSIDHRRDAYRTH